MRQLASRAAHEACCTSPLAFAGDKRGRMREILAGIIHRIPSPLDTSTLEFSAGPATWSYDGSSKPIGALKVTSARIALPDPACVVKLADWLPEETARKFVTPESTGNDIGQRYFQRVDVGMETGRETDGSLWAWPQRYRQMRVHLCCQAECLLLRRILRETD